MASFVALLVVLTVGITVNCEKQYLGFKVAVKTKEQYDSFKKIVNHASKIAILASEPTLNTPASVLVDAAYQREAEIGAQILGLEYKLVLTDVLGYLKRQHVLRSRATSFDFNDFYDIDMINEWLVKMEKTHPGVAEVVVGGETSEGRKITGLKISSPSRNKKVKPIFVIEAGIHAREWIAPSTAAYVIHQLLTNRSAPIKELFETYEWHIFPVLNPDGYHYSHSGEIERYWRKNRAKTSDENCVGVDLNRNWDYNWEDGEGISPEPCDDTYGGKNPFSEKETSTFRNYLLHLKNITVYSDFHSFSKLFLIPYSDSQEHQDNYDDMVQPRLAKLSEIHVQRLTVISYYVNATHWPSGLMEKFTSIGKNALKYLESIRGTKYGIGTAAETLYGCAGTSIDWVKKTLKVPIVWCYELDGDDGGFAPDPSSILIQGAEVTNSLIGMHEKAKDLGYIKKAKRIPIRQ